MSRISILNETEQLEFDYPPNLSLEFKALAFTIRPELDEANKRLLDMTAKLSLPSVFVHDADQLHGASDGQKLNVGVDCLLANWSFKYFGKDKGVSVYTFIDERQVLFHSLVMSAPEREAAYLLVDGLNNSISPHVSIQSTDTHGYTETIFAGMHFHQVAFAPRIKNIGKQTLYGFYSKGYYQKTGYQILPSSPINQKLIRNQWDNSLRFMTTIKLKECSASQLYKRLSSYAKHNPLYRALKEFSRIIKSLFILKYYDDLALRQRIEKQLNRVELSNKFSKAIFYANNQEFKQADPAAQKIATACRTLIQNSIVLWNYLYLSQVLANCDNDQERKDTLNLIKEGSVLCWGHINLHGEFDFRKRAMNEPIFDIEKILALKLA